MLELFFLRLADMDSGFIAVGSYYYGVIDVVRAELVSSLQ